MPHGPSPDVLWPPNHQLVPTSILGVTSPDGDVTVTVTGVRQDVAVGAPAIPTATPRPTGEALATDPRADSERSSRARRAPRVFGVGLPARDPIAMAGYAPSPLRCGMGERTLTS